MGEGSAVVSQAVGHADDVGVEGACCSMKLVWTSSLTAVARISSYLSIACS
ncbi:MAG: hypothetical protein HC884_18190 [Chloroflexaceae bacterium]|nr:hypothetical protein [Chloroflexaceae bacterium]